MLSHSPKLIILVLYSDLIRPLLLSPCGDRLRNWSAVIFDGNAAPFFFSPAANMCGSPDPLTDGSVLISRWSGSAAIVMAVSDNDAAGCSLLPLDMVYYLHKIYFAID